MVDRERSDRQLNLFGERPEPTDREVGPARVSGDQRAVAAALPGNLRMGTSSWSFPGWRGLVYDREATKSRLARHGLEAYARHPLLRAVGVDRTFYSSIPAAAFAGYAAVVPDGFRFVVKASSFCTTPRDRGTGLPNELFLDVGHATAEVVGPYAEGLRSKAGALVFQFPPLGREWRSAPERFADRLGEFLSRLPRGVAYAVELRDRELLSERYFEVLEAAGASHCYSVHPRMPSIDQQRRLAASRAGEPVVVRWMLRSGLGYEEAVRRYQPFSRIVDEDRANHERLAELVVESTLNGRQIIITVNNKAEGSAPLTVFRLADAVARQMGQEPVD
jgi:uncharacterized protein YecE (DUF72 family)